MAACQGPWFLITASTHTKEVGLFTPSLVGVSSMPRPGKVKHEDFAAFYFMCEYGLEK